jgi:hypothetical protein
MQFSIHIGNHFSNPGIADTVRLLKFALLDCGHDVPISTGIDPERINLVMEHFVNDASLQRMRIAFAAGARYILIGTAPIIGRVFNSGLDAHHEHYSNADYWKRRCDAFVSMVALADAISVMAEDMVPGYQALAPTRPVLFWPHGHVQDFAFYRHVSEQDKDIDFYFSGNRTEHRTAVLHVLGSRHGKQPRCSAAPSLRRRLRACTDACRSSPWRRPIDGALHPFRRSAQQPTR